MVTIPASFAAVPPQVELLRTNQESVRARGKHVPPVLEVRSSGAVSWSQVT